MKRTKINPGYCWVIGWAHLAEGVVMILSAGVLATGLPYKATLWAARKDAKIGRAKA